MSLSLSLRNAVGGGGSKSSPKKGASAVYGRVVDVILDELHPMYLNKGGGIAINGVFYKPLNSNISEEVTEDMPFAYQKSSHIKVVPLIENIGDATLLVPMIKEYMEIGVKNDEHLIKLATVIQRLEAIQAKGSEGEMFDFSELQDLLEEQEETQIELEEKINDTKEEDES